MIIGIGTDICKIERINLNINLAEKVLSDDELVVFSNKKNKQAYLAKRFAAKEAISKAFGCGIGEKLAFKDISVLNNKQGAPFVNINKSAIEKLPAFSTVHISISDEKDYAIAYAVVEKQNTKV